MGVLAAYQFPWCPNTEATLRKAVLEGKSATEVARMLTTQDRGPTRSAVIGKATRMGLTFGLGRAAKPERALKAPPVARVQNPLGAKGARRFTAPTVARDLHAANAVNAGRALTQEAMSFRPDNAPPLPKLQGGKVACEPRPWTERRFGECVYPVDGEGADTRSCCNPTADGRYCIGHARLCYAPAATTKKKGPHKPSLGAVAIRAGMVA